MELKDLKNYRRDALLGALGAILMLTGDLCLSVISPSQNDSGLFMRECYLNGSWESWRLSVLIATGFSGMSLEFFALRVFYCQILPSYHKTRTVVLTGGVIILATGAALHLFIGSLADWTTTLSPLLGREEAVSLIAEKFNSSMPGMYLSYVGMALIILSSSYAVLTKKTILPWWMIFFHIIVFQILFVLIPDIRQSLGMEISTWDYVLSQGSTNASFFIWMTANAVWAEAQIRKERR